MALASAGPRTWACVVGDTIDQKCPVRRRDAAVAVGAGRRRSATGSPKDTGGMTVSTTISSDRLRPPKPRLTAVWPDRSSARGPTGSGCHRSAWGRELYTPGTRLRPLDDAVLFRSPPTWRSPAESAAAWSRRCRRLRRRWRSRKPGGSRLRRTARGTGSG